ncbi:MAG: cache domain-containing protein [Methanoregula sp.]
MYDMILNLRPLVILGLLSIALLFSTGCTQNPEPVPAQIPVPAASASNPASALSPATPAAPPAATKEKMVAFVKEAVVYAKQNGKEKALAEFSNPNGSFFRGVLYIYAYDMNGTTIAHPVNPEKIGVNRLNEKDAEGNLFIQDLRQAAINDTGFVTYYYINPIHKNAVEKKLGYAMIVDSNWWLGSGIYQGPADTRLPPYNETASTTVTVATPQGK